MRPGDQCEGWPPTTGGCGRWPLRHQPRGRGPACRETANRVGRIQHRDYGWPGGFARVRSRRPGGELGAFTARTKAMTRRVGSPRLQNAGVATKTSSETKATNVPATIHGTQAIPADNITAPAELRQVSFSCGSSSPLVIARWSAPCVVASSEIHRAHPVPVWSPRRLDPGGVRTCGTTFQA